ncbi:unnamed protein product [Caretta caretta]
MLERQGGVVGWRSRTRKAEQGRGVPEPYWRGCEREQDPGVRSSCRTSLERRGVGRVLDAESGLSLKLSET